VAKPRTVKKRQQGAPAQPKLAGVRGEWEVVGRPCMTGGG
jgi:hypothetical protein